MERLTKYDKDGTAIAPEFADETYIMQDDNDRFTGYINSPIVDRLAELEDKIEDGTLVELPCIVSTLSPKYVVIVFRGKDGKLYKTHSFDIKDAEAKLKELKSKN